MDSAAVQDMAQSARAQLSHTHPPTPDRVPVDPEVLRRLYLVFFEADLLLRAESSPGLARARLAESVAAVWADLGAGTPHPEASHPAREDSP